MKKRALILKALFAILPMTAFSQEVMVADEEGQCLLFDANGEKNFSELSTEIASLLGDEIKPRRMIIEVDSPRVEKSSFFRKQAAKNHGEYLGHPRDYFAPVSQQEFSDLRFIITFVASKSLVTIAKNRETLESTADRIDHIHPLRFLLVAFSNEELKAGIRTIRGRGSWLWANFFGGLKQCFVTESSIDNMKDELVVDFAKNLGIDSAVILPSIQRRDWDDFVNLLIALLPRKEDPNPIDN